MAIGETFSNRLGAQRVKSSQGSQGSQFLGVLLDQHLTMEKKTAGVVKRCFGILITLRKISFTLPKSTLKTLLQSLVFPHLTYCLPAWAPPTISLRRRIDKVINFATRVVMKKRKFDHITGRNLAGYRSKKSLRRKTIS